MITRAAPHSSADQREGPDQDVEGFLGTSVATAPIQRLFGAEPELGSDVAPRGRGRKGRDSIWNEPGLGGRDLLHLHHPALILAGDRDEDVGAASDQLAIEEDAARIALIGPGVLVGDENRRPYQRREQRPPDVGAELVGVDDIDSTPASEGDQLPPGPEIKA